MTRPLPRCRLCGRIGNNRRTCPAEEQVVSLTEQMRATTDALTKEWARLAEMLLAAFYVRHGGATMVSRQLIDGAMAWWPSASVETTDGFGFSLASLLPPPRLWREQAAEFGASGFDPDDCMIVVRFTGGQAWIGYERRNAR